MLGNEKREIVVPGDKKETVLFCVNHFIQIAQRAIEERGAFFVALSGGSTPKAIFESLVLPENARKIEWAKVHVFWSDERAVPPEDAESNYKMAMDAGLKKLPIPPQQIHRMVAEKEIEKNALAYEKTIQKVLKGAPFDLMMLGMGEDGHTASLFPGTEGVNVTDHLAIANYIPQKKCWRMTLTFPCINASAHIAVYVLGEAKRKMLEKILGSAPSEALPASLVGSKEHKALWICDTEAAGKRPKGP